MSAKVSIIVPVYNLEKYVGNCIRSLMNQTYENIEILCIDDGSTDNSAAVITKLAEEDCRVKYIHKENGGVSSARNKGLDNVRGEYVLFIDGDDYFHYRGVEILVNCIENSDFSVVCAKETKTNFLDSVMDEINEYSCQETDHKGLFSYRYGSVLGKSACNKLYKSDVAKSVRFIEDYAAGEDANYVIKILTQGVCVGVVDKTFYYYYTRENSNSNSSFTEKDFSLTLSFDELCEHLKISEYAFLRAYCLQYLFQAICIHRSLSIGTSAQEFVLTECKRIGNKWLKEFIKNSDINIVIRIAFVIFFKSRHLYEFVRMIQDPTMKDFYKNRKKNRKV